MASRTVAQRELRNNYNALLREAEGGAEIIVTVQGRPVARLGPVDRRRRFATRDEMTSILSGEHVDVDAFMADVRPPDAERVGDEL